MGLLSWFFPSAEDRIATARKMMGAGRWGDARLELLDVDHNDARVLLKLCERELVKANLDAAVSWASAGDTERVQMHLELAEEFDDGTQGDVFRAARAELRRIHQERSDEARRKAQERETRLLAVDPFGLGGGNGLLVPAGGVDLGPDEVEREARIGLLVEGYPEAIRGRLGELPAEFGIAALEIDDGRPDRALQRLLPLDDTNPLVLWELHRAAYAMGDPAAAARALRRFADAAGGHQTINGLHSGEMLAQLLAEANDVDAAIRVLRDLRAAEPKRGRYLLARLLEAKGELAEADALLRELVAEYPREDVLYLLLARVRVRGGDRKAAMAALEAAMATTCDTPGRCGHKPPNPAVARELATLYLEDGVDARRGLEVADIALSLVGDDAAWEDVYLQALAARQRGEVDADEMVRDLHAGTQEGDPRRARLDRHLPVGG